MRRTLAALVLGFSFIAVPIYTTGQTSGGGITAQQSGQPGSMTGSAMDPDRDGFDFGWLGLLGLAGLLGLRHTNRTVGVTR